MLDSVPRTTCLVISSEFMRKQEFKLKITRLIYIKNIDNTFNKKGPIEYLLQRA